MVSYVITFMKKICFHLPQSDDEPLDLNHIEISTLIIIGLIQE